MRLAATTRHASAWYWITWWTKADGQQVASPGTYDAAHRSSSPVDRRTEPLVRSMWTLTDGRVVAGGTSTRSRLRTPAAPGWRKPKTTAWLPSPRTPPEAASSPPNRPPASSCSARATAHSVPPGLVVAVGAEVVVAVVDFVVVAVVVGAAPAWPDATVLL